MITITEFETVRNAFVFGTLDNEVTIRIKCDDEGLQEIQNRVYGIESPSRHYVEKGKDLLRLAMKGMLNGAYGTQIPMVKQILISGICTIVFWLDGTKTIVRCKTGTEFSAYNAFTAALAKKIYGSNSRVNKIIKRNTQIQKKGVKKDAKNSV